MLSWVDAFILRIWPDLRKRSGLNYGAAIASMRFTVGMTPFAIISFVWLVYATELDIFRDEWLTFLLFFILLLLLNYYEFSLRLPLFKGQYAEATGTLTLLVGWSAVFLFGPTALWLEVVLAFGLLVYRFRKERDIDFRWQHVSSFLQQICLGTLLMLISLTFYEWWGADYPLDSFATADLVPALLAQVVWLLLQTIFFIPYAVSLMQVITFYDQQLEVTSGSFFRFLLVAANMSSVAAPFAIIAAVLYSRHGLGVYLFFATAVLLASILAHRLSAAVVRSEQRSSELATLEQIGRALLNAPPDPAELPQILETYVPGMFSRTRLHIWFEPDQTLYQTPDVDFPNLEEAKQYLRDKHRDHVLLKKIISTSDESEGKVIRDGLAVPMYDDSNQLLGGLYLMLRDDFGDILDFLPASQSLISLITSAIQRAEAHVQEVANERMSRELEVAGDIQASFLPRQIPTFPGWDMAAMLQSARQTSGDFYDFVPLPNGRLGVIVADVADKGTGAALYMALSRTLIRTYAMEYPDDPAKALAIANERILSDTESDQFVTVFYGVIDLQNGRLTYANAGHNPGFLINTQEAIAPQKLGNTGIPLGMFEQMQWKQNEVEIAPHDVLLLYTDGVSEAQDTALAEFGEERLLMAAAEGISASSNGHMAQTITNHIITAVEGFVGDAPQFDDITLMVITRMAAISTVT